MKTILAFQGGGALGAFGAGAWDVLSTRRDVVDDLVAVAGASIGAINAACVVKCLNDEDHGASAILSLWQKRIATAPMPFLGTLPFKVVPSAASVNEWNGFMTGVFVGTTGLSRADWTRWQPIAGMTRLHRPLHDRGRMIAMLREQFAPYHSAGSSMPLLAAPAVDIMAGKISLFDSDSAPITDVHLAASTAIPLFYDPVEVDGRLHWDGEMTRESWLPALCARLLQTGRIQPDEPLRLITVEQFPQAIEAMPETGVELVYRLVSLLQLGKLQPPRLERINIESCQRISRPPLPEDGVSGQFDFSPSRIDRLIDEGRAAARACLEATATV